MKKILLIISLFFLCSSLCNVSVSAEETINTECISNQTKNAVKLLNLNGDFIGNGFLYKNDNINSYIVTSSSIENIKKAIFSNGTEKDIYLIGKDENNEIAVYKTAKIEGMANACMANSSYAYLGQKNYMYGFLNKENDFYFTSYLEGIGIKTKSNGKYIGIYKNYLDVIYSEIFNGTMVIDENNYIIGIVNGYYTKTNGMSYYTDSNRIKKIADTIINKGKYEINYLKYAIVDYSSLSKKMLKEYKVSDKASYGVVVYTLKPLNYVFGGLNMGMTIIAVNNQKVVDSYSLDNELQRYDKNSYVCLKVIKSNGKETNYFVKI